MNITNISVCPCNYSDPDQLTAIGTLMNAYIADRMGGGEPLTPIKQLRLVDALNNHPTAVVLLANVDGVYAGMLVAFENFSTFTVRPMLNIHDVIVLREYRNMGVGRRLMEAIVAEGEKRRCSRITLEVRHDNAAAQKLYRSFGFGDVEPPMLYWRKALSGF
ncbi:MAG: GNAT family N-acetyltransferase [Prevotella sp.]|jgi:GNAT superfamily N-acetyltransferase|nr:GNAT family N-acetyltransferase [Prevotella sp.]